MTAVEMASQSHQEAEATTLDRPASEFVPTLPGTELATATAVYVRSSVVGGAPTFPAPPLPLIEKRGDLFSEPGVKYLAHCISADCKLGAGIAKAFVSKFGPASFRQRIAATRPIVGSVAIVPTESGKVVYNLVTKEKYWEKPTLPALIETLIAMRSHARAKGVDRIAMPRIGCGLDQLAWPTVREAIEHVFARSGIQIVIVELAGGGGATSGGAVTTAKKRAADSLPVTSGVVKRFMSATPSTPEPPHALTDADRAAGRQQRFNAKYNGWETVEKNGIVTSFAGAAYEEPPTDTSTD